jgi:hypothetical protein
MQEESVMNKKLLACLASAFTAAIGCSATQTAHTQDIKTLSSTAKTAAGHESLASHYEAEAKLFEDKVAAPMNNFRSPSNANRGYRAGKASTTKIIATS